MKKLLIIFIILLLAIGLGYLIHQDSGYVLVTYSHWSAETSLWVAIILWLLSFLILYFLIRLFKHTTTIGSRIHDWHGARKERRARKHTHIGLCELAEGQWEQAEDHLAKSAKESGTPLINFLAAAKAAHEQEAYDRRDNHLRMAHSTTKGAEIAVGLSQAELQISSKQWEQALATLKHLNQIAPKHRYVLKLLATTCQEVKDWETLTALVPKLRKYNVLIPAEINLLEQKTLISLLEKAAASKNKETLAAAWNGLPKSWKTDVSLIRIYVKHLLANHLGEVAVPLIETTLKKNWDSTLINYYGLTQGQDAIKQLSNAESWLKKHPRDPALLLCLGRLCLRDKLWGKARNYLESSLAVLPQKEAFHALGQALEALGEKDEAIKAYRDGLSAPC